MLQNFTTKLVEKRELNHDTEYLKFELVEPDVINFTPGQYLLVHVPREGGGVTPKHFSIANAPSSNTYVEFLAKIIPGGIASEYFKSLRAGDAAIMQGAIGFFGWHESERDAVLLATGTGLAPMLSMLREKGEGEREKGKTQKCHLFWGLRTYEEVYYLDEFKKLRTELPGFEFTICLSREKDLSVIPKEDRAYFFSGHVNEAVEQKLHATSYTLHDYYLCGSRTVVESLRQFLYDRGAPREQVYFEKF